MEFDFKGFRERIIKDTPTLSKYAKVMPHIAIHISAIESLPIQEMEDIVDEYTTGGGQGDHFYTTSDDRAVTIHLNRYPGEDGFERTEQAVSKSLRALNVRLEAVEQQNGWADRTTGKTSPAKRPSR